MPQLDEDGDTMGHRWKLTTVFFAGLCALLALAACKDSPDYAPMNANDFKNGLEGLSKTKVYFGHQSVGRNILQGLEELSKATQVTLQIGKLGHDSATSGNLIHSEVGSNKDPLGKIADFSQALARPDMAGIEVAILKFCYLDVAHDAVKDPRALVDAYARAVDAIRAAHPKLKIVHATVPLRSDPPGWKTAIKRWIGRETWEDPDNVLRNAYNEDIRKRFAGQPLFDIALAESTLPDGSRSGFVKDGKTVYTLATQYTNDGGHLNERGRQQVAAVFAKSVADAMRAPAPAGAPAR